MGLFAVPDEVSTSAQPSLFFFFLFPLAISCGMWDLSSPTSDPGTGRQSLNHWTAREVPQPCTILNITFLIIIKKKCGLVEGTPKVALTCSM